MSSSGVRKKAKKESTGKAAGKPPDAPASPAKLIEELERALRESEQRFKVITEAMPVMVWMSGTDKLCTYFNKSWLDFVGRTLEQESGNGWAENVHPDDFERCLQIYVSSFDARQPFEMHYRLRHHTGEFRWILDYGVPRYAPDGTGVNPSTETVKEFPGCRSLRLARRTRVVSCSMRAAEEAEASSAGEQLAKEYSAGNSSHR